MFRKLLVIFIVLIFITAPSLAKNVIILSCTEWAPYTGVKLNNKGFFTEICETALKRSDYKTVVKVVPWKRAVEMTKKGKFHALLGASYTKERTSYFKYPNYFWGSTIHFFAKKGHNFKYKKIKDLCPSKLGILYGSFLTKRFKKYSCFKIETVPKIELNIKKLANNRLDLFLDTKDSVNYYLNSNMKSYKGRIIPLPEALITDKIYLVFSKQLNNYKKLTKDFDKGILKIKNDGTYNNILKKHGML